MDKRKKTNLHQISEKIAGISKNQSLSKIIELLQAKSIETIPILDNEKICGMIDSKELLKTLRYLNNNSNIYASKITAENIMTNNISTIPDTSTIEDILEKNAFYHAYTPIVDENNNYTGECISRKKLICYIFKTLNLGKIIGIATPIGIYLTDGLHQTGSKDFGLVIFGAFLAFLNFLIDFTNFFINFNEPIFNIIFKIILFLILFKILPISSILASKHKVINAMNKGLPLTYDIVEAQSPIYTNGIINLFVLGIGILFIFYINYEFLPDIWIFKFFLTFIFLLILFSHFKHINSFLQKIFLTKNTSKKQILQAIHSAENLQKLKQETPPRKISALQYIYTSGVLQIIVGFLIFINIINLIFYLVLK